MIIDSIKNLSKYEVLVPGLTKMYEEVLALDLSTDGKFPHGNGAYLVANSKTKSFVGYDFELHKKFLDVQIILEGSEEVAWEDINNCIVTVPYNEEKDIEKRDGSKEYNMKITKGMFYIAFPHDAHRPGGHTTEEQTFKKVVLKIPV